MRDLMVGILLAFVLLLMPAVVHAAVPVEVNVNSLDRIQGDTLIIQVSGTASPPKGSFLAAPLRFVQYNGSWMAFGPIADTTNPGTYWLEIQLETGKTIGQPIRVGKGNFKESRLTVSESQAKIVQPGPNDQALIQQKARDKELIREAYSKSEPLPLWTDTFIRPAQGKITTEYGYTRYVNGVLNNRHSGLDIANSVGTPILAVNDGIVRLAGNLLETGYTVIVDHGAGLFSSYSHLSKLQVKAGEMVYRGQTIGQMGNTGFSTGSHLHWVMRIGETYLNPTPFIGTNLFRDVRVTLYRSQ